MGLAWELKQAEPIERVTTTQFLLANQSQKLCNQDCAATKLLRQTVDRLAGSIDLWLVNFYAPISLPSTCGRDKKFTKGVYGYKYQLYHCQPIRDTAS